MVTLEDFHTVPYCDDKHGLELHAHEQHEHKNHSVLHVEPKDPLNNYRRLNISQIPIKSFWINYNIKLVEHWK